MRVLPPCVKGRAFATKAEVYSVVLARSYTFRPSRLSTCASAPGFALDSSRCFSLLITARPRWQTVPGRLCRADGPRACMPSGAAKSGTVCHSLPVLAWTQPVTSSRSSKSDAHTAGGGVTGDAHGMRRARPPFRARPQGLARTRDLQLPSRAIGNPRPGVFALAGRPLTKIRVLQLIFGPTSGAPIRFAWSEISHRTARELQIANFGQQLARSGANQQTRRRLPPAHQIRPFLAQTFGFHC